MKNLTKHLIRAGVIGASLMTMAPLAASAGEWRINVRACPGLREDRIDRRTDNGWRDRREDRRDERVVNCPARAWYYVRYRGEPRNYIPPRPRNVVVHHNYRYDRGVRSYAYSDYYYRGMNGARIRLDLNLFG